MQWYKRQSQKTTINISSHLRKETSFPKKRPEGITVCVWPLTHRFINLSKTTKTFAFFCMKETIRKVIGSS